ncbi:unnamed protein product, partial [Arabidopsis halleri]
EIFYFPLFSQKPDEDHELSPDEKLEKFSADLGWLSAHELSPNPSSFKFKYLSRQICAFVETIHVFLFHWPSLISVQGY